MPTPHIRFDRPAGPNFMRTLGLVADPWQADVLDGNHRRLLLNCSRQAGKSTAVALLALLEASFVSGALVLLLSRSLRQSAELFSRVVEFHKRMGSPFLVKRTAHELRLKHERRILSLPCSEPTIRGFSDVHMIVIDEAARVPDELYYAVRPMTAVNPDGRIVLLSTPCGKRGFFYDAWAHGGPDWTRIEVPASQISRITPAHLEDERRAMGEAWFRQEYFCSFESREGVVYPDFAKRVTLSPSHLVTPPQGRRVGGLDFGFHNPFAAVWGVLDHDDILWLTGEHYEARRPLSHHIRRIPKDVDWYADPSGANEIAELRCAGFTVNKGVNALALGIAAVSARLENGTLRILDGACPHLLAEAELYCYSTDAARCRAEIPEDDNNHALGALRYLIAKLDARKLGRKPKSAPTPPQPEQTEKPKGKKWLSVKNEALWSQIWSVERQLLA